jgi:hypothetical protein
MIDYRICEYCETGEHGDCDGQSFDEDRNDWRACECDAPEHADPDGPDRGEGGRR